MARNFVEASGQYLVNAAEVLTAAPITMACWFRAANVTGDHYLMSLANEVATDSYFVLLANGAGAGDPLIAWARSASASDLAAKTSTGYSANVWQHGCAVFASSTSRSAYLNGGGKVTSTVAVTPASISRTGVGVLARSALAPGCTGDIAEVAIWNVALTDVEVAILALGYSPLLVRPASLVAYWPLIGRNSPENDRVGDFPLTVTGATVADHCRIIRARSGFRLGVPGAAAAATGIPHLIGGRLLNAGLTGGSLVR